MRYAMSDLHGDFDAFLAMLEIIDLKTDDTLYILGDVIDRGSRSIEMLQFMMKMTNCIFLLGNHEAMMLDAYDGKTDFSLWHDNGGYETEIEFETLNKREKKRF